MAALHARGIAATGPVAFNRPVELPNGQTSEAAFSVFHWPVEQRPADMRLFACQHHTRDTVWIAELQAHANSTTAIARLEIVTPTPADAAAQLASLIDTETETIDDGMRVRSAPGRGDFVFLTPAAFKARHPALTGAQPPTEGVAALVCRVTDLDAAARCVGPAGHRSTRAVSVNAKHANGVMLVFEAP